MSKDDKTIGQLLSDIEKRLDWGSSSQWTNKEYKDLSEMVFEKTKVTLSHTTLKRIWGHLKYESNPSTTTLDTLCQYLDYPNWRSYKSQFRTHDTKPLKFKRKNLYRVAAITLIPLLIALGFIFLDPPQLSDEVYDDVEFSSRVVTSGYPNSVVFDLNLSGINSDSILIQQSWDVTKTVKVKPGQKTATGIYYIPGFFQASLKVDGKAIKQHDLFLKSEQWMATIDDRPIPTYVNETINQNGVLTLDSRSMEEIAKREKPTTLTYHLVKPLGIKTNDFHLETSVRNTLASGPSVCQTIRLILLGTVSAAIVPVTNVGCISDINLMYGDLYLSGKENDLSAFSNAEMGSWQNIRIDGTSDHLKVLLNGEVVFDQAIASSIGDLVGFRYSFLGAGEIDYIRIESEGKSFVEEF